jgi:hypothetical protein
MLKLSLILPQELESLSLQFQILRTEEVPEPKVDLAEILLTWVGSEGVLPKLANLPQSIWKLLSCR